MDDYRDVFTANPRAGMAVKTLERMRPERRQELAEAAVEWLGRESSPLG